DRAREVMRILKCGTGATDARGEAGRARMAIQPNGARDESGSGVSIRDLRSDAKGLARGGFEGRHGRAFPPLSPAELAAGRPSITEVALDGESGRRVESTAGLSLIVFAVRRNGRSASHLITLGRAPENDVVVPDVSISRFHAFVKEGAPGCWLMQDA